MELTKLNIHMNQIKKSITSQITLEDDFNVSDIKPDIDSLITDSSNLAIDSIKVLDGRILIKGKLEFRILYSSGNTPSLQQMTGNISIDEVINMDDITDGDCVSLNYEIDDLNIGVINSRKISVRSLITFKVSSESIYDIETATNAIGENIYTDKRSINITQIAECKKDIFRVKESIELPPSYPVISELLWDNTKLRNLSTKLGNNELLIFGEISAYVIYKSDITSNMEWYENTIPFNGSIPLSGIDESMIPDVEITLPVKNISIRTDSDGEERILEFDIVLDLNIKVYKEINLDYISDIYSTNSNLCPVYDHVVYNGLIMKNISKCKVNDKLKPDMSKRRILQICGNEGEVKAEDITVIENGIKVDGVIIVNLMAITDDDSSPLSIIKEVVPFTHTIEARDIDNKSLIYIRPTLEHFSTFMNNGNEIEVKATASLDTLVLSSYSADIITNIQEEPLDMELIKNMPGLTGYRVQENDSFFDIAKKFHTTVEDIKETNNLISDLPPVNEMLLIVKMI